MILDQFCESEVNQLQIPVFVNHDIFKLQVSMHVVFLMELSNRNCNLSCVKLDLFFLKSFALQEMLIKFSSSDKWHDKEKSQIVLEYIVHTHKKRGSNVEQNVPLQLGTFYGLGFNQNVFSNGLDCVKFSSSP